MLRQLTLCLSIWLLLGRIPIANAQELTPTPQAATGSPTQTVSLSAPVSGQALLGVVTMTGNSAIPGFSRSELSFAYSSDPTGTWFLISENQVAVENGILAQWDTTTITDGDYQLRLVVRLESGQQQIASVNGLRVRNYTAVETETPAPSPSPRPGNTPEPTSTPTPTLTPIPPTVTALPPNPAIIEPQDLYENLGRGALGVIGFFSLIGVYLGLHNLRKKKIEKLK